MEKRFFFFFDEKNWLKMCYGFMENLQLSPDQNTKSNLKMII